ncbi:MAG: hypothetical protein AAFV69_15595 [Pseudomonadota bacterium]
MQTLNEIDQLFELMPAWLRVVLLVFFIGFSVLSVYARINLNVGEKVFSRIPRSRIRRNVGHILQYTILPTIVAAYYTHLFWGSL